MRYDSSSSVSSCSSRCSVPPDISSSTPSSRLARANCKHTQQASTTGTVPGPACSSGHDTAVAGGGALAMQCPLCAAAGKAVHLSAPRHTGGGPCHQHSAGALGVSKRRVAGPAPARQRNAYAYAGTARAVVGMHGTPTCCCSAETSCRTDRNMPPAALRS